MKTRLANYLLHPRPPELPPAATYAPDDDDMTVVTDNTTSSDTSWSTITSSSTHDATVYPRTTTSSSRAPVAHTNYYTALSGDENAEYMYDESSIAIKKI